ncbi:DUF2794 domain-containing protein [Martelella sp. FLE1502]|uniref:DUF2794 domain-containing protein n=1 Tax=Martelella TaxID=293088 RepID=UPI000C40863C|nr:MULTISPECIES: DUF2794 domain-containing protein [Martelella]MAU19911.1 hypothetical protein [Martelella sp.]MCD1633230.1 DUF2794 domain-containing protein [Martelella mediterranea]
MADKPETQRGRAAANANVVELSQYRAGQKAEPLPVTFHRRELDAILWIYGRMVGEGEWRDYALDHLKDKAVFSVFKRAGEMPLYRIEKNPKLAARQGAFSVTNTAGMVLKRGHDLKQVLKVFDRNLKLVEK